MYVFDHVVHAVKKPELALECLQQEGLHAVMGGKHDMWGTYNALSYFDLSYIECIGIFDEAKFEQAAREKHSLHASIAKDKLGLTRFAVRTTTIEQDAKTFREAGFDVSGPTAFSRTREDGTVVSWQLLYVGTPTTKVALPFFIQWDEADDVRRATLETQGVIAEHVAGNLQLAELHFVVPDFVVLEKLAVLCGVTIEKVANIDDNVDIMKVLLPNITLVFQCPTGDGYAWDYMLDYGYGIQKLVLTGANVAQEIEYDGAIYEMTTS